jgi:PAS domain S-box-containing protein
LDKGLSLMAAAWRGFGQPPILMELFDQLPDVIVALKDTQGRYLWVSSAICERCGLRTRDEAIGRKPTDLFPGPMAVRYEEQDQQVIRSGRGIHDALDLTVFSDGSQGWCLTQKLPIFGDDGQVIALTALSRDLIEPSRAGLFDAHFVAALDFLQVNLAEPLRVEALAARARLSASQFERRMKRLFFLSPAQYLLKLRIEAASELVLADQPLREVAQAVGFCDQAALTRAFKKITGMTPGAYRATRRDLRPAGENEVSAAKSQPESKL